MERNSPGMPYRELVALVDHILDECEDNVPCVAKKLDALDTDTRSELLVSDLLNAYQAFFFLFRTEPDILTTERMELEPASSLRRGILIEKTDLLEMYFIIHDGVAVIVVHDGDKTVATFSGRSAYGQARTFMESPEYQ